ncbi:MAG: hypothetical protein JNG90_04630 [Planctomycetaceae bacterium]|nr:hypothetical protein [Planctomycetaceae bacterium]
MNDDELKKLWQQQPLRESTPSTKDLISAMQSKASLLRRCLEARDFREIVACALVVLVFGVLYFTVYRSPLSRAGVWIVIGGAIFIAWKLVRTRRRTPPAPPGATVVESLRAELILVRSQVRLLGSVLWWYLLPGFIGVTVATWGLGIDPVSKTLATGFFIAVDAWVYWLNQRAVSQELRPLETQLQSLLHAAETGEPPEETQAADLRAIVVSMAAADRVKPVEFKVAFWQLAVFGIPGIVGIWFFLIFSFARDGQDWTEEEPAPVAVAQALPSEEADRYSTVARTIVALLNAGNVAGVQTMFTPKMNAALPPTKSAEFFADLATRYGRIEACEGPLGNGHKRWPAFRLRCKRGEMTMSLALTAEGKVSGLYFRPRAKPALVKKPFLLRLFSWQHLAWLPPFFLGGLLYTWLIQKSTERAVGISTLGIHLARGHVLVLWDEIAEVRPMRFLHIRNLWLIRPSGEKTLMHWTPLERHADLMAAVKECAPANHPIREYLPLLTRS